MGFEDWWGEPENKVIDAMRVIKDYCEKQNIYNACPMFHTCTQIGKKQWIIPNKRSKEE
jgi:hypothetical protein